MARAQLEVLKIQLEPHFLFNTLNSIAALARYDGEAAEHMTLQLADLLRMSLDGVGVQEVPLQQELMFLQKYIDIQQTRFRDRLQVETDIDPRTVDTLVPNLILQPLVENAIRHGIGPRRAPGLIRISTWRDHDDVWMEIRDNGTGLDPRPRRSCRPRASACATLAAACNSFTTKTTPWCWKTRLAADAP